MPVFRSGRRALVVICLVFVSLALAAPAQARSGPTDTTEAPPATDTTPTTGEDLANNDNNIGAVLLLLILGIGLAAIVGTWAGRRNDGGPSQAPPATGSPRRELLANVRWLHDQLSVQVLSGPPDVASQQWASVRFRVQNMAIAANQYSSGAGGGAWQRLSQAITDTSSALDYVVSVRTDPQASSTTVTQASSMVSENRAILMQSAEVAARTVQ